ncbi:MAG: PAS domain-containing sensor histidine kinase, partial [Herminiimonas sp.]|nr:PAS domain-containing sensor histidine kinase [Herminiimonas sp.]
MLGYTITIMQIDNANRRFGQWLPGRRHGWRWILPVLLVLFFLSVLFWLPWQAQQMEATERQEQLIADTLWVEQTIRFQLGRDEESLRLIGSEITTGFLSPKKLRARAEPLIRNNRELSRIVWLDAEGKMIASSDDTQIKLDDFSVPSRQAAVDARKTRTPRYSQPGPKPGFTDPVLMDYFVPLFINEIFIGNLVATFHVPSILEQMVPWWFAQENE